MNSSSANLICFGMGYTARALAASLDRKRWKVSGTIRGSETAAEFDVVDFRAAEVALAAANHVLVSVPPDAAGDSVLLRYGDQLGAHGNLRWIGYLSTTGVYGDTGGALADEATPCNPTNARSQWRLDAERAWLSLAENNRMPLHIFRLAGIYGPGRSTLDNLRAHRARRIDRPGFKFSRIHVADAASVLRASIAAPRPGTIYNVCDDVPAAQADVISHASGLLGLEPPPLVPFAEVEADLSPMARTFWSDNRRIDNSRIKSDLGITLLYPDYRAGLAAIMEAESSGENMD
ncbi:MAG: SDR family oxidoreductase [Pseudomonadota bacterium]|nr:SDR family oxidoreductase [Pseudomonadota bacterium]